MRRCFTNPNHGIQSNVVISHQSSTFQSRQSGSILLNLNLKTFPVRPKHNQDAPVYVFEVTEGWN